MEIQDIVLNLDTIKVQIDNLIQQGSVKGYKELLLEYNSLLSLLDEINNRSVQLNPVYHGLPDLLFPKGYSSGRFINGVLKRKKLDYNESDEDYRKRQDDALREFIEDEMFVIKSGVKEKLIVLPEQLRLIGDLFFGRVKKAIVWKGRGSGGSLAVAILIWLCSVYRKISFLDLAGTKEQAQNVYNYVRDFWECFPLLKEHLVCGEPMVSKILLNNGASVQCLTASDNSARGKHERGLILDEACQKKISKDEIFKTAINGTLSEKDPIIVMLSTFHIPVGLFQETWDNHEKFGYERYKWDCFDAMRRCTRGLEFATKDDPDALNYCRYDCPLTDRINEYDDTGRILSVRYEGCNGKARKSNGFRDFDQVYEAKIENDGGDVWRVEFCCNRPRVSGPIFGLELIERSEVDDIEFELGSETAVGIDWGYDIEGCMVLIKDCGDFIGVLDCLFLSKRKLSEWIETLHKWAYLYSDRYIKVYADGSHPFNNREIEEEGFDITRVYFQYVRDEAQGNLQKYFNYRKIKIYKQLDKLLSQLKKYSVNPKTGKPLKKDDHGPDALEAAFLHFPFSERFGDVIRNEYLFKNEGDKKNDKKRERGEIDITISTF